MVDGDVGLSGTTVSPFGPCHVDLDWFWAYITLLVTSPAFHGLLRHLIY